MSGKTSYSEALSSLTEILSDREKELEAREKKMKREQEQLNVEIAKLNSEKNKVYFDTSPNDVLNLNVGGTKVAIFRRTLTSVPDSMLASMFSGRWDDSLDKDKDGYFFINQRYSLFGPMLDYLMDRENGTEKYPMVSIPNPSNNFLRMVEYYGMTQGLYPTTLKILPPGSADSVEMIGPNHAIAKSWTHFRIVADGHGRRIKTYEVTIIEVQRIQIGWTTNCEYLCKYPSDENGVGDVVEGMALDLFKSKFLVSGRGTSVEGLAHAEGTVVRSEDYGKRWYVNGELVHSEEDLKNNYRYPVISVKGEMKISFVDYS
mmetsp:Transcript_21972/g.32453  ORF Transcript_21972/g.32453 Transcript_21972/m.32453 type:complete len:317 (-) Transcript_21972:11-961(-)